MYIRFLPFGPDQKFFPDQKTHTATSCFWIYTFVSNLNMYNAYKQFPKVSHLKLFKHEHAQALSFPYSSLC